MNNIISAALFTDGGSRPQTGFGGWGVSAMKLGEPKYYVVPDLTDGNALIHKYEIDEHTYAGDIKIPNEWEEKETTTKSTITYYPVTKISDVWGTMGHGVSSNRCELSAMINALMYLQENNLKTSVLLSDSSYVINGMDKLQKHCAIKSNKPVEQIPNYDLWLKALEIYKRLKEKNYQLKFNWVKGHSISTGNTRSDLNATRGVAASSNNISISTFIETIIPDTKKSNLEKAHGFLLNNSWYFTPNTKSQINGYYVYATGDHGKPSNKKKEFDWVGKNRGASTLTISAMKEQVRPLEKVKERHLATTVSPDAATIGKLTNILSKESLEEINKYGNLYIFKPFNMLGLTLHTGKPLTQELHPPMLAYHLLSHIDVLTGLLFSIISNELPKNALVMDITDQLYTKDPKGKLKLNKKFIGGETSLSINVPTLNTDITLTIGIDLLPKNGFSRIIPENPTIKLIVIPQNKHIYNYFTHVSTDKGQCIVSAYKSNSIVTS